MVESIAKVWVRTSVLDKLVHGKVHVNSTRTIPGSSFDSADVSYNWGWSRANILHDDSSNDAEAILNKDSIQVIKLCINDEESPHNHTEVKLPGNVFRDGDLVIANIFGDGQDDDDGSTTDKGEQYPDDLVTLTHLHEPDVVYSLRKRYMYDKIYTSTGPILLALNPFKNCKELYTDKVMETYWTQGERLLKNDPSKEDDETKLPPHVYSIADNAFRTMKEKLNSMTETENGVNQSILVSGESGAGKTVTTKYIMQYLATLSKRADNEDREINHVTNKEVDIEQQVLQSNPILESFGNARTIRNDNSSRFGKFIEIQFNNKGVLVGASIDTYLLEKVRLVSQAEGERNYHIFYELLQGMDEEELDRYHLSEYTAKDFKMTNQSGTYDRRDGVSDSEMYRDLITAMQTMGFEPHEQSDILTVTCALLHASNTSFKSLSADESTIDMDGQHLKYMLSLMGLSGDALNRAMCYFSITAGREKHVRSLSVDKAEKGMLALIKATYGALFTYIVGRINESITVNNSSGNDNDSKGRNNLSPAASISVLDIFGFESFQVNSFEQLCINYCNEALQQQFNMFVLRNEQDEYEREGIQWSFISFPDNQNVLNLIDKKGTGILNILDDQCRAPGTTDTSFINYLYSRISRQDRFQADQRQVGARKFGIVHYAGVVEYFSNGFVEKNRDELPREASNLLLSSSNDFVKRLAEIICGPDTGSEGSRDSSRIKSASAKLTVGSQFRRQLQELRQKIDHTSPHYVRCLKPNNFLEPDHFDPLIVTDQLRSAGVIEAVRVSRLGYPHRYTHSMFLHRYHMLGAKELRQATVDVLVSAVAEKIAANDTTMKSSSGEVDLVSVGVQVGRTKVFLRRNAYEVMDRLRNREIRNAVIKIQSMGRRYIAQQEYNNTHMSVVLIQRHVRRFIACKIVGLMRSDHNSTLIQKAYRRMVARRYYMSILMCNIWTQRMFRGRKGRMRYNELNKERKALTIETFWRCYRLHKVYRLMRQSAVMIQCAWRSNLARNARDLQSIATERDALRAETQELRSALEEASKKIKSLFIEIDVFLKNEISSKENENPLVRGNFDNQTKAMEKLMRERDDSEAVYKKTFDKKQEIIKELLFIRKELDEIKDESILNQGSVRYVARHTSELSEAKVHTSNNSCTHNEDEILRHRNNLNNQKEVMAVCRSSKSIYVSSLDDTPASLANNPTQKEATHNKKNSQQKHANNPEGRGSKLHASEPMIELSSMHSYFSMNSGSTRTKLRTCMSVRTLHESLNDKQSAASLESARLRRSSRMRKSDNSGGESSPKNLSVNFDTVQIREYPIILGDNPAVQKGPALTIDWQHVKTSDMKFEEYESKRRERRSNIEMTIPSDIRIGILKNSGYSNKEILEMTKKSQEARTARILTNSMSYRSNMHESIEKFKRGMKNMFTSKKKKEREYLKYAEQFHSTSSMGSMDYTSEPRDDESLTSHGSSVMFHV